jgi:hypothetical protein
MTDSNQLDDFLDKTLSKESDQEQKVEAHADSYFDDAADGATMKQRAREFDDVPKHWVRRELWLKSVKRLRKRDGIRLLTLPGRHHFEVKLYAKEKLLKRVLIDGEEHLAVVGFETDPTVFGLLTTERSPPILEMLCGDVLQALVVPTSPNGLAVRKHAPYDVINLDLTANISSKSDGPYTPFLRGVRECFQIQGNQTGDWVLMVTFRVGMADTEPRVVEELKKLFQENLQKHLLMKESCQDRYGVETAKEVLEHSFPEGLGHITAKWVITQAHQFEWGCPRFQHAHYRRRFTKAGKEDNYSLCKLVFQFSRHLTTSRQVVLKGIPDQSWHADDYVRILDKNAMLDVDVTVSNISASHRQRLTEEIEEFRCEDHESPSRPKTSSSDP